MTDLKQRFCVACEADTPPLSVEQAEEMIIQVPAWELQESKLMRRFRFKDFKEAMAFVNKVADLAESEGHHPDIYISWNRVRLELTTHAIKGLSENDFIMAAKVSMLNDGDQGSVRKLK